MKKGLKRLLSAVLALVMLFSGAQFASAANAGLNSEDFYVSDLWDIEIEGVYYIDYDVYEYIDSPRFLRGAAYYEAYTFNNYVAYFENNEVMYGNEYGATIAAFDEYNRYDEWIGTVYYIVIVGDYSDWNARGYLEEAYNIEMDINYRSFDNICPDVYVRGTVDTYIILPTYVYGSATHIDEYGCVYGDARGSDTFTAIVVDTHGNYQYVDVTVNVKYTFVQWLIKIFLLGFLWY